MAVLCSLLVVGQVYFDLKLPDYMSQLTVLIKQGEESMSLIKSVAAQMLGCVLASTVLCVLCGYLASKVASGFSFSLRSELFRHVFALDEEQMHKLSVPGLITRTTNDVVQLHMMIVMALQLLVKAPLTAVWAVLKILGKSTTLSIVTAAFVVAIILVVTIIIVCLSRFAE